MIEWFDPKVKLPEDKQECLLMPHGPNGLLTVGVFGPIPWAANFNAWIDLFRESEAGAMLTPDLVGCWTLWDQIKPPKGLPTPFEKET